ncbi:MAG TPA: BPSS1780 family membrane protein [Bordetella sp.]
MQAASLPATSGWQWIRAGLQLFRKQPLAMFTWAMVISLFVVFAALTLPIGALLLPLLMPVITVMTLAACKHVEAGRIMLPSMWPKPLLRPGVFRKLMLMGLLYTAFCIAAELVAVLPFADDVMDGMSVASTAQDLAPLMMAMRKPMLVFVALYVPIAALFWHAPVLVAWHGVRLMQSLFFSIVACWRCKWAFLVYGVAWALIFMFIDLIAGLLVTAGMPGTLVDSLQVPVNIIAGGVLYCSFYPAYTSVFGIDDDTRTGLDHPDSAHA